MNNEFVTDINDIKAKIYMQIGFFDHRNMSFPPHEHPFSEIHILLGGSAVLRCGLKDISLTEGDVLLVPPKMSHSYKRFERDSKRITFFVDCYGHSEKLEKILLPKSVLQLLCHEIQRYILTGNDGKLKPLISYICSDFFASGVNKKPTPITSRELILNDFFRTRYNTDITLCDLAKEMMLSKKQTAREVKRITGNTFTEELSKRRMSAAVLLSQSTDFPLTKIAELVGYSSYSGFYKAYKRMLADRGDGS